MCRNKKHKGDFEIHYAQPGSNVHVPSQAMCLLLGDRDSDKVIGIFNPNLSSQIGQALPLPYAGTIEQFIKNNNFGFRLHKTNETYVSRAGRGYHIW